MCRLVVVIVLTARAVAQSPDAPARDLRRTPFLDLLQLYQRANADEVVEAVASRPALETVELVRHLPPGAVTPKLLLLELETALYLGRSGQEKESAAHLDLVVSVASRFSPSRDRRAFTRLWYRAAAALLHEEWELELLQVHLKRAMSMFPEDGAFRMAEGASYEALVTPLGRDGMPESMRARPAGAFLSEAASCYNRAIRLTPTLDEARLRLGRVRYLQHRSSEATGVLLAVRNQSGDVRIKYLAALFLGRIYDDEKDDAGAMVSYGEAAALFPRAQTARIGFARAALAAGQLDAAASSVARMLGVHGKTASEDPWWNYNFGEAWHLSDFVSQMWDAVDSSNKP